MKLVELQVPQVVETRSGAVPGHRHEGASIGNRVIVIAVASIALSRLDMSLS